MWVYLAVTLPTALAIFLLTLLFEHLGWYP